jgi:hypothetical protein
MLAADEDLNADAGRVQPDGVFDIHRDLFVGKFLKNARTAAGSQEHGLLNVGRNDRTDDAASAEQGVAQRRERHDGLIDAFQAGGGSLEVAVVEGQHHGPAGLGIEGLREAMLHAPVEIAAPLEEIARGLLRHVCVVILVLLADVGFWHGWIPFALFVSRPDNA